MGAEKGHEDTEAGSDDIGDGVEGEQGDLDSAPPEQEAALPAARCPRHRLVRTSLRVLAYAAVAVVLFGAGWLAHARFQGGSSATRDERLAAALLPAEGATLDVRWGDLPQRLVQEGVIDIPKLQAVAQRAGLPITPDQLRLLTEGSDEPFRIDDSNAYFVLDLLWALGLANRNRILTEGPIAQRGWEGAASYASTGGWTIGAKPGPQYLAALELIRLTPQQQAVVEEVAANSYRPCCGNMTAFPDCNHGMAALGLAELMASQGATADAIFLALKKVSPFWFPTQYHHLALYFELQGQKWEKVDPRLVMGREHSSAGGWQRVNAWLEQRGALSTSGQGKASGCAP